MPYKGQPVLAFDLGGSHVAAAVIESGSETLAAISLPLVSDGSRTELLEIIESAGDKAIRASGRSRGEIRGIGMAAPNPFDYAHGISLLRHKHPALYGCDLRECLARRFNLGPHNIAFLNDANAFLLGEIVQGNLESSRIVGLAVGTGIGSAFAEKGRILTEDRRIPPGGEIWNLPWGWGIVEDALGTKAICAAYERSTGKASTVKEIAAAATTEEAARAIMQTFGRTMGEVINSVCKNFSPDCIVLGGGIARCAPLFVPQMLAALTGATPDLRISSLSEAAGLYGAAQYWWSSKGQLQKA